MSVINPIKVPSAGEDCLQGVFASNGLFMCSAVPIVMGIMKSARFQPACVVVHRVSNHPSSRKDNRFKRWLRCSSTMFAEN